MNALEIFYEICKIPHSSGDTGKLKDFICDFAKKYNCNVRCDDAGNIHIIKGNPRICLQAHYDMVLIGDEIKPYVDNGFLKSIDSSLGADNGIAVAAILYFIANRDNIEALITNDEEIGMIGVKNLALEAKSRRILNLDSENINEICIGCAGGFDAKISLKPHFKTSHFKYFYEIQTKNFIGGHSGIDIHKNIKNAIVELVYFIYDLECEIVDIIGGEKTNSIPVSAKAIIATNDIINDCLNDSFIISKIDETYMQTARKDFLYPIFALHSGVYAISEKNVISSLNISKISTSNLEIMARANRKDLLHMQQKRLQNMFDEIEISDFYDPWEAEDSAFLEELKNIFYKNGLDYDIIEIHAGLECGILKSKCDEIVSIGPTIYNPHSKLESLDLDSFDKFLLVLDSLV